MAMLQGFYIAVAPVFTNKTAEDGKDSLRIIKDSPWIKTATHSIEPKDIISYTAAAGLLSPRVRGAAVMLPAANNDASNSKQVYAGWWSLTDNGPKLVEGMLEGSMKDGKWVWSLSGVDYDNLPGGVIQLTLPPWVALTAAKERVGVEYFKLVSSYAKKMVRSYLASVMNEGASLTVSVYAGDLTEYWNSIGDIFTIKLDEETTYYARLRQFRFGVSGAEQPEYSLELTFDAPRTEDVNETAGINDDDLLISFHDSGTEGDTDTDSYDSDANDNDLREKFEAFGGEYGG